jgi:hypothetical protein
MLIDETFTGRSKLMELVSKMGKHELEELLNECGHNDVFKTNVDKTTNDRTPETSKYH